MSEPFDPNALTERKRGSYDWATYVPSRRPKFKVHEHRGHAINAMKWHAYDYDRSNWRDHVLRPEHGCKLYRRQDGKWVELPLLPRYTRKRPGIIASEVAQ